MALRIEPQAEPIPGYRLIERLGSGGFGEVWKAEAPGGLFKAIKFVQRGSTANEDCVIGDSEVDRSRAEQEWKSLIRVKSVRHPFILLLDRFENIENYLVIVMELADRTLADRFKECRSQGLPGIPREELLGYLTEAAEVLDLMNSQYQLQHLDIKPQNLFLVHQHIKVADFGLVKDTTDGKALMTITGGVTPVYAAPETFDGQFSRQSDQYSLAIVYQEMLTGQRPFSGTTMKQLVLQHLQNSHDLSSAPVHDRTVLTRALARNPDDRFPTCVEFIQALKRVGQRGGGGDAIAAPTSTEVAHTSPTIGARGGAGPIKTVEPNFSVNAAFLRPATTPPKPKSEPKPIPQASDPLLKSVKTPPWGPRSLADHKGIDAHLSGVVQPALIIGLGRIGIDTLTQLRQHVATEFGTPTALPQVRLLAIDTDPDAIQQAAHGNPRSSLRSQETLLARLQRPSHYLKTRDGKLPTDTWLNAKNLHRIPREQTNAGLRSLGRLAFVDNHRVISRRLEAELQALTSPDTPHEADGGCDLGVRTTRPRVYVVSSLTGNTGGGMFVDLAYLIRSLLNAQGHDDAEIVGLFFVPEVRREPACTLQLANSYAALLELQHYCRSDAFFTAHYETAASQSKGERVTATGSAYQRCLLLPLGDPKGKPSEADNTTAIARASGFLFREVATVLGAAVDDERRAALRRAEIPEGEPVIQSTGAYRIHWPRHAILDQSARHLCSQLVTRWLNKDASVFADTIRQWTHERWESLGMRPENLIERFQSSAETMLGQKSELLLAEILAPVQKALASGPGNAAKPQLRASVHFGPVVQAMERLERAIGTPDESRSTKALQSEPATMERVLMEIAHTIADDCEQKLAELAVQLLEDPDFRLAGAEEALRQFCNVVDQAVQSQETLTKELCDKATQLHVRIHQLLDLPLQTASPTKPQWSFGMGKRSPASAANTTPADLFELVRTYTKTRYHGLVLTHLNRLYVSLRGHLSDQIREVGFCRQRLGELLGLVQPINAMTPMVRTDDERLLFPPGCADIRDAVGQLSQSVGPDDLIAFDRRVQAWVETHCEALLQVCMGSSSTVRNLAPAILHEAEIFLGERLQGNSVAEMYLKRKMAEYTANAEAMIADDLEKCLDEATPPLGRLVADKETAVVSFPDDEAGRQLEEQFRLHHPGLRVVWTNRAEEIVFYHESFGIEWSDLDQLGPIAREAYDRRAAADPSSLHTREDVFDWQFVVASGR